MVGLCRCELRTLTAIDSLLDVTSHLRVAAVGSRRGYFVMQRMSEVLSSFRKLQTELKLKDGSDAGIVEDGFEM